MDSGVGWSRIGLDVEGIDDGALEHGIYGLLAFGDALPLRGHLQFLVGFDDASLEEETAGVVGVVLGFG